MSIVVFLDILGARSLIRRGQFPPIMALDFVNPVGIAAQRYPGVRFAAFSDSVIAMAAESNAAALVKAVGFLYAQWLADFIWVRGAMAIGEIHWIDDNASDDLFAPLPNFTYARIFGASLVEAVELETRSGPGAVCFLTPTAAQFLSNLNRNLVLEGPTPIFAWADERHARLYERIFGNMRRFNDADQERQRLATHFFFSKQVAEFKFAPDELVDEISIASRQLDDPQHQREIRRGRPTRSPRSRSTGATRRR